MALQTDMSPADDFYALTPNDSADLAFVPRALLIAVGGTVKFTKLNGNTETVTVPAGPFLGKVRRLWATGTTATGFTGYV